MPAPVAPSVPALSVPYQGFAASLQTLRLAAQPLSNRGEDSKLSRHSNALCYSPGVNPSFFLEVMDTMAKVPGVCSGGLAESPEHVVPVDFNVLHRSPECSLRFTLAPEVPLQE